MLIVLVMPGITLNCARESPDNPPAKIKLKWAIKEPYRLKLLVWAGVKKSLLPTVYMNARNASDPVPNNKAEVLKGGFFFANMVTICSSCKVYTVC